MGRSFWAPKGYLALAPGPPALALARPTLGTRTNEKLPPGAARSPPWKSLGYHQGVSLLFPFEKAEKDGSVVLGSKRLSGPGPWPPGPGPGPTHFGHQNK